MTPDGCAVDVYERLKAGREPDVVTAALQPGATLLELGCGAGRVTQPLAERGFRITAVDESAEMLERVRTRAPAARTVHAAAEDLALDERFDAVMLASFLVHTADDRQRTALLAACRRHVRADGCVLIEREGLDWYDRPLPSERHDEVNGCVTRMVSAELTADGRRRVRIEYEWPDATWAHEFVNRPLTREAFEAHLAAAGLAVDRYLTDDGVWVRAVPTA